MKIIHRFGKYRLVDKGLLGYKIEEFLPAIGEWFEYSGRGSKKDFINAYINYLCRDYGPLAAYNLYDQIRKEIIEYESICN